jgi:ABC-type antimicrobial peptide transport system permease subunit
MSALLAAIGLYGVISYSVVQRTREIGIRLALGARFSDVRKMVVGQGLRLVGLGVLVALPLTVVGARLIARLLFGVRPTDLVSFAGVAIFLGAIGVLASYLPARRAARIQPLEALRHE